MLAATALAQQPALKSYRINGGNYIAVTDLAKFYNLGRSRIDSSERAEYRTSTALLYLEAERRDVVLNGVNHWLSWPVQSEHDRLWVSDVDVLKVIDPVLRSGTIRFGQPIRTVVLDPGHGGSDHGTHSVSGYTEKELTLDLAKRVQQFLADSGVRVVLTRTADRTVDLDDRVEFCRAQHAALFVSLHFNSGGNAEGIETYCMPPAGAAATSKPSSKNGDSDRTPGNRYDLCNVWLAHCVQKSLLRATGTADRGVRRARFVVLRDASCPAILVEGGFLSNPAEERKILTGAYRDTLAKAIGEGILTYKKTIEPR
ncbi:MAG: N-acetylmuramoyl-L-alanine amidase [Verrucomicrobiia bacterium]